LLTQGVADGNSRAELLKLAVRSTNRGPVAIVQAPNSAKVVHQISQRVIRKLRKLGFLESGIDATVATGHDPLVHNEPELARRLAASVQPRIAS
jgi:hypothetical protein